MYKMKKLFIVMLAAMTIALGAFAMGCKGDEKFTLAFNTDGGAAIADVSLDKGAKYDLPTPEKIGYEFDGWYLASDFSGNAVTEVTVETDMTVYAKWTKLYLVSFDLDGGNMSEGSVYLKSGENLSTALKNLEPTKADHKFGAWSIDGKELTSSYVMPENDVVLTAKYMVKYTVDVYREDFDGNFVKEEQAVVDYAYAGTTPSKDFSGVGFALDSSAAGSKPLSKLSETASDNAFALYFKRESYSLIFRPNYPVEKEDDEDLEYTLKYGESVEVPYNYTAEGYYLAGWSTSVTGETVDYETDYISSVLFNGDESDKGKNAEVAPEKNTVLYGVWVKGSRDMFGGDDYLFLSKTQDGVVYISRAGQFFKGSVNGSSFTFKANGNVILRGRIFSDGTFAYADNLRQVTYINYINGQGVNNGIKLMLDEYNGLTYIVDNDNATTESAGTYTVDENGYYVATFTEGDLSGEELYIRLASATIDGVKTNVFIVRDDEEIALGKLYRAAYSSGLMSSYPEGYYHIELDGFGTASYYVNSYKYTYYYVYDKTEKILTLSSSNSVAGTFRIIKDDIKDQNDYVFYDADYDKTFESADKSATLTLDGAYKATYVKGNEALTDVYYTSSDSLFSGGKIISLLKNGKVEKSFLITAKTETVFENGEQKTITTYSFEEKAKGYAEFYYRGETNTYITPLFVLNDTEVGHMSIYGYTSSGEYELLSEGRFSENNGLYSYTAEKVADGITKTEDGEDGTYLYYRMDGDNNETVWMRVIGADIYKLKKLDFGTGKLVISSSVYDVVYYQSAEIGDKYENYVKEYVNGKSTLTIIGGMVKYESEGKDVIGTYTTDEDGVTVIEIYNESNGSSETVYVSLDDDKGTYAELEYAPYTAYAVLADGSIDRTETVKFDGKGGAIYTIDGNGVSGKVEKTDKTTEDGYVVKKFVSDGLTFEYIEISLTNGSYFAKANSDYKTEYEVDGSGSLELDGFCWIGKFVSSNGDEYKGYYTVPEENVVKLLVTDGTTLYFDIKGDSFTKRGDEYGTYLYSDNNILNGLYFAFDGYGKLDVKKSVDGELKVVGNGVYTLGEDYCTVNYTLDGQQKEFNGKFGSVKVGNNSYKTFAVIHTENVKLYINGKDWSVLELDAYGNAVKYDAKGNKENGTYTLITGSLLYFVNQTETDACLYEYDFANGTAAQLPRYGMSYYTKDLESLNFTEYGFAIFNGSTRYYYDINDNDEYIVYRQPAQDEDLTGKEVNEYGFIVRNIGELNDEFEYEGKTYYYNDGNTLTFGRVAQGGVVETKYPLLLTSYGKEYTINFTSLSFQPSGSDEFSVQCYVDAIISAEDEEPRNTKYSGYVVRAKLEDGTYETYLRLTQSAVGYYRFDLDIDFRGVKEDSDTLEAGTYTITSLKRVVSAPAYKYLDNYYVSYLTTGTGIENDIGDIEFVYTYGEDGKEIIEKRSFRGEFLKESGIVDINDRPMTVENAEFEEQSNGLFIITFKVPEYVAEENEILPAHDEYDYKLYVYIQKHSAFVSSYGYRVYAFTRLQENLTANDDYTVTVERLVYTEVLSDSYPAGSVFTVSVKKGGEEIKSDVSLRSSTVQYIISRTYVEEGEGDDKTQRITSTKYYAVTFKEADKDAGSKKVMPYESATVTETVKKTYYGEDGKSYFDIDEAGEELSLIYYVNKGKGSYYIPVSTEKEGDALVVKTSDGSTFTITITGETATIDKTA